MPSAKLPKTPQTSMHTSATNGNNCLIYTHTRTLKYTYICIYVFMTRICSISCALFAGRKRIMAPTNCTELKRKMCSRPAGRPQAVNVIPTHIHTYTHTRTQILLIICARVLVCFNHVR